MPTQPVAVAGAAPWTTDRWRAEVDAWIRGVLAAKRLQQLGPTELVRLRPWSVQLTVETSAGLHWFKENHPGQAHEARLVELLGRLAPERVVVPTAIEPDRGWLLSPDHGETLATLDRTDESQWTRIVSEYAQLQRKLVGHDEAMRACSCSSGADGDPDEGGWSVFVRSEVERLRRLPADFAAAIDTATADAVLAALPRLRALEDRIGDVSPTLRSLQHNDLHSANVFIPRPDEATLRFFDFADALWSHPFVVLGMPMMLFEEDWSAGPDDPRVRRVVDAYLEPWSDLLPRAEARAVLPLVLRLSPLHRFESWRRLLVHEPAAGNERPRASLLHWLGEIAAIEVPAGSPTA